MWFDDLDLVSNIKKGISSSELQSQLGLKSNEPVWYMMHKVCKAMASISQSKGKRPPLSDDTRSFIENRSEIDCSNIRIHKGSEVIQMKNNFVICSFILMQIFNCIGYCCSIRTHLTLDIIQFRI